MAFSLKKENAATIPRVVALLKSHAYYKIHWQGMLDTLNEEDHDAFLFMLAARWADDARGDGSFYPPNKRLDRQHYINLPYKPPTEPDTVQTGTADPDVNIFKGYQANLDILGQDLPADQRSVALTWLCHLVGDVHQPLHTASLYTSAFQLKDHGELVGDRGGTWFYVREKVTGPAVSLHHFWDELILPGSVPAEMPGHHMAFTKLMPQEQLDLVQQRVKQLFMNPDFTRDKLTQLAEKSFEKWGRVESFTLAQEVAYRGDDNELLKGSLTKVGAKALPAGYAPRALSVAERRVVLAGFRLADLLKEAFKDNGN